MEDMETVTSERPHIKKCWQRQKKSNEEGLIPLTAIMRLRSHLFRTCQTKVVQFLRIESEKVVGKKYASGRGRRH